MATTEKNQHPSIAEFKQFVKKHPKLIKAVRSKQKNWQELYEDWVILGEEDEMWDEYKMDEVADDAANKKKSSKKDQSKNKKIMDDIVGQVFSYVKKMDFDEVQQHMTNINGAITNVQEIMQQFQNFKKPSNTRNNTPPQRLPFRKD